MEERLRSRKLWVTLAAMILVAFARVFGIEVDEATIYGLVALVSGYNVGQGIADGREIKVPEGEAG